MSEKIKMRGLSEKSNALGEGKYHPFALKAEQYGIGILNVKEIIDNTTSEIFTSYWERLLIEPITYIIPAIWGEKKDGRLSFTQKEINKKIAPMISNIMEMFDLDGINRDQRFAIEYLIRGLMISKITYMIEAFKNQTKR